MILGVFTLLLSACHTTSASGYDEPRGYDQATLKLVFSMDSGQCLNRFTYDSKLAPSHPGIVACDSPDARIRNDGFHANAPGCMRIDYESITRDGRAYYCQISGAGRLLLPGSDQSREPAGGAAVCTVGLRRIATCAGAGPGTRAGR